MSIQLSKMSKYFKRRRRKSHASAIHNVKDVGEKTQTYDMFKKGRDNFDTR